MNTTCPAPDSKRRFTTAPWGFAVVAAVLLAVFWCGFSGRPAPKRCGDGQIAAPAPVTAALGLTECLNSVRPGSVPPQYCPPRPVYPTTGGLTPRHCAKGLNTAVLTLLLILRRRYQYVCSSRDFRFRFFLRSSAPVRAAPFSV